MATSDAMEKKPLWLSIEEKFLGFGAQDLSDEALEETIQRVAGDLDAAGYRVSGYGGNLLQLRWALADMRAAGRPLMQDVGAAIDALTLEQLADPYAAVNKIISDIGRSWPKFRHSDRRVDVIRMVEKKKRDLLIARAKELPDDEGIRLLIEQGMAFPVIVDRMEITEEKLAAVNAAIEKERAARAKVEGLLAAVADKGEADKVRYLFDHDISEKMIVAVAHIQQSVIDAVKQAMEAELQEKQRLAEEAAAQKKAAAEGPALEDIPSDQMLEYIEGIREIMEFSDQEKEIRVMCEQSAIPKALVDIAVSDPDKLDALEKAAEG